MTPDKSQTIILGSMAVAVGATVVSNLAKSKQRTPTPRIVIGGFVVTIGLLVTAEWQPGLAQGLAVLILAATLVANGDVLFATLTNLSGPKMGTATPHLS